MANKKKTTCSRKLLHCASYAIVILLVVHIVNVFWMHSQPVHHQRQRTVIEQERSSSLWSIRSNFQVNKSATSLSSWSSSGGLLSVSKDDNDSNNSPASPPPPDGNGTPPLTKNANWKVVDSEPNSSSPVSPELISSEVDPKNVESPNRIQNLLPNNTSTNGRESANHAFRYDNYKSRFPVPNWVEEYLSTTSQQQKSHNESLVDPEQKFMVLICHKYERTKWEDCGGLADRLKYLPYWVWIARNSNRKLLIKYTKLHSLEHFFAPPNDSPFDWRLPDGYLQQELDEYANRSYDQYRKMRWYADWHERIHRSPWKDNRVVFVNSNLFIMNQQMEEEMNSQMGMDQSQIMPGLFRRMFQPVPAVAQQIVGTAQTHRLVPGQYAGVHLRLKYPLQPTKRLIYTRNSRFGDKRGGGLSMEHEQTRINVEILSHNAINCAMQLMPETRAVYVASDSNEVPQFLSQNSSWIQNYHSKNGTAATPIVDPFEYKRNSQKTESNLTVVHIPEITSRLDAHIEPIHFDTDNHRTRRYDPEEMYSVFVDLWILGHAKCVAYGLGGFAQLVAMLTGNFHTCRKETMTAHRGVASISYCPEYLNQLPGFELEPRQVMPVTTISTAKTTDSSTRTTGSVRKKKKKTVRKRD